MLKTLDNRIKYSYFILVALLLIVMIIRNSWVPFNHDEMATFVMYIQGGEFWPYHAIVDANNHFLNSGLSHVSFKLFGDSLFALRLPNLGAFILMSIAVYRFLYLLKTNTARIILISVFTLSFHWLSFYNICRGYGMSMALFLTALLLLHEYVRNSKWYFFYGFLLAIQLAISANLTLLLITLMMTILLILYQILNKKLFHWIILLGYFFHFVTLLLWIDYSFFLQEGNALYYGQGDSYWEITFVTLIELITGIINIQVDYVIAGGVILISTFTAYRVFRFNFWERVKKLNATVFYFALFIGAILAFFVLHHWKGINFPEDRTGLFFYPLFMLMFVFLVDEIPENKVKFLSFLVPVLFGIHFLWHLNFKNHPMNEYETFPERFYTKLYEEQEKSEEKISISGHRLNELMFAYFNYRHDGFLNPVDDSGDFNIYSDYGITKTDDANRYEEYYEVIDEADWNFVLLKRKKKCKRILVHQVKPNEWLEGNEEYYDFLRLSDTSFNANQPLLFEMNFDIDHAAQPLNAWLVLDVKDADGNPLFYKRAALNWIRFTWNGKSNNTILLSTDKMPEKTQSLILYLWCNKKQFVRIKMNKISIYKLIEQ